MTELERGGSELTTLESCPDSRQINDMSGVDKPIEVKVFGPDVAQLRKLAAAVGEIVEQAGAAEVNSHVQLANPDLVIRVNRAEAGRVGLTAMDVESQIGAALYGQIASTLPQQDRITNIRVRYPDAVRYDRECLASLPIDLADGTPASAASSAGPGFVSLGQIASINSCGVPISFGGRISSR